MERIKTCIGKVELLKFLYIALKKLIGKVVSNISVKKYSLKAQSSLKLSENFCVWEFKCNDGTDTVLISEQLVEILQKIRGHFNKSVNITSAYRTVTYNAKIGGVTGSQHTKGTAADIYIEGVKPCDIAMYAEYIMGNCGGIGLYDGFVHIDVRKKRSRWKNNGREIVVSGFYGYSEPKKELESANDIIWQLSQRINISDINTAVKQLDEAKGANSSLYWICRKLANS